MGTHQALNAYANVTKHTSFVDKTPHKIVSLLMENAINKLIFAKNAIQRNDIATKGASISVAITIIEGLNTSLDHEQGEQIADNLANLYDYLTRTLLSANLHNDLNLLDNCIEVLATIKDGWDNIDESE